MTDRVYTLYIARSHVGLYIGCTSKPVELRWKAHLSSAACGSPAPLHCAIRERGSGAFTVMPFATVFGQAAALDAERCAITAARLAGANVLNGMAGPPHTRRCPECRGRYGGGFGACMCGESFVIDDARNASRSATSIHPLQR